MKKGDMFPSKWLKAADIPQNREVPVVIDRVTRETTGDDEEKAVVYFRGAQKGLMLNNTNWDAIEIGTGKTDSDDWTGEEVLLYRTTCMFKGNTVECIRLRTVPKPALPTDDNGAVLNEPDVVFAE